jgi:hypothetical protein
MLPPAMGRSSITGKLFRVYTKSHFLEHLVRDTGGHTDKVLHYKVTCLNHLIDVAAYTPPEIKQLGSASCDMSGGFGCGHSLWRVGLRGGC